MFRESFRAMGTDIEVCAGQQQDAYAVDFEHLYCDIVKTIERLEVKFSRFRADSELSFINENPGSWMNISADMTHVLALAEEARSLTNGIFNPGLGSLMEQAGYDRSFDLLQGGIQDADTRDGKSHAGVPETATACTHPTNQPYEIERSQNRIYLNPGYKLDVGGIAKGWIVEQVAQRMHQLGWSNFTLSAGGDMVCAGSNDGKPWRVGVETPWRLTENALVLDVTDNCVATSGTYRRQWRRGSEHMHHIIDPMSGRPAETDVLSCTVIAHSLVAAEVYAKTCLIMGSRAGTQWLLNQPQRGWVVICRNGEVRHSWSA